MSETIQKVALLSLRTAQSSIVFMLKPLGKRRLLVFEIFLYDLVRPIWNLMPTCPTSPMLLLLAKTRSDSASRHA